MALLPEPQLPAMDNLSLVGTCQSVWQFLGKICPIERCSKKISKAAVRGAGTIHGAAFTAAITEWGSALMGDIAVKSFIASQNSDNVDITLTERMKAKARNMTGR